MSYETDALRKVEFDVLSQDSWTQGSTTLTSGWIDLSKVSGRPVFPLKADFNANLSAVVKMQTSTAADGSSGVVDLTASQYIGEGDLVFTDAGLALASNTTHIASLAYGGAESVGNDDSPRAIRVIAVVARAGGSTVNNRRFQGVLMARRLFDTA